MECPIHNKVKLKRINFRRVEVDFCPKCLGLFFNRDELRLAKDDKDQSLRWLDFDLWQDKSKFKISRGELLCPDCQLPMYTVEYGDSGIRVEICVSCESVWLNRGEFKKIIVYLEEKAQREIWENYWGALAQEVAEVFVGPETLKEEILDVVALLKVLNYKLLSQFPVLAKIAVSLQGP